MKNNSPLMLWGIFCNVFALLAQAQSPPSISPIQDQRTFPNLPTRPIPFVIGDTETPADQLTVSVTAANTILVPATNIVWSGSGSNQTVRISPAGMNGVTPITVAVQDSDGLTTEKVFLLTIADFTEIQSGLPQLDYSSAAWGDVDNDGFLDLLVTGSQTPPWIWANPSLITTIYRNNGNETFTDFGTSLQGVMGGGAAWGDYNNDGKLDILLTGLRGVTVSGNGYFAGEAQWVCRNVGSTNFVPVAAFENPNGGGFGIIPRLSLAWGDYDNDGKLDGVFVAWPFSILVHNEGNDVFSNSGVGVPIGLGCAVAWADYNNDAKLDFVVNTGYPTSLYRNNGSGNFSVSTGGLAASTQSSFAWDDANNDGNLDLATVGGTNGVYFGDGLGTFTNLPLQLQGGFGASIAWGDFDNDGKPDLVIACSSGTRIYHNDGGNSYSDMGILLPAVERGGLSLGDFNNDGRLDIALTGYGSTTIFRNDGAIPNTPPDAPVALGVVPTNDSVILSWSSASDSEQSGGLSYNLRIGTTPGGIDVVAPMANVATGQRRLAALGNAGLGLSRPLTKPNAGTYYWSVQAIDHSFAGSSFAPEQSFTLELPTIASQPMSHTNIEPVASFNVTAAGTPPFSYQWLLNGKTISDTNSFSGTRTPHLSVAPVRAAELGEYSVTVSNLVGSVTSAIATVTILSPIVTNSPTNLVTWIGNSPSVSVGVSGGEPLTYQWRFNGVAIPGQTNRALSLDPLRVEDFGQFDVVVVNGYGNATSSPAMLIPSEVAVWGGDFHGELNLPVGLTNIMGISAGPPPVYANCVGLRGDGKVIAWPRSFHASISNLVSVTVGQSESLGLRADGSVIRWTTPFGFPNPPSAFVGLSNIVAITPSFSRYLVLKADATVIGNVYSIPAGLSNVVAVAQGANHNVALRENGTVVAWGNSGPGATDVPAGLSNVIAIAAGYFHNLALCSDGRVVGWGHNAYGQVNVPTDLTNVVAIAAGSYHSVALKNDGAVVAWGRNDYGQTNVPTGLKNVVAIAAGQYINLALIGSSPPLPQVTVTNFGMNTNGFHFELPTQLGRVYSPQYENSPLETNWSRMNLEVGNGGLLWLNDTTATNAHRFYRVLRW